MGYLADGLFSARGLVNGPGTINNFFTAPNEGEQIGSELFTPQTNFVFCPVYLSSDKPSQYSTQMAGVAKHMSSTVYRALPHLVFEVCP